MSELGISFKRSTLSDILKNEDKIANAPDSFDYRDRKAKYPALEDRLYMFLNQLLSNGISINDDILLSKAKEFACFFPEIAKDGFRFSHGWEDWLVKINNDFRRRSRKV